MDIAELFSRYVVRTIAGRQLDGAHQQTCFQLECNGASVSNGTVRQTASVVSASARPCASGLAPPTVMGLANCFARLSPHHSWAFPEPRQCTGVLPARRMTPMPFTMRPTTPPDSSSGQKERGRRLASVVAVGCSGHERAARPSLDRNPTHGLEDAPCGECIDSLNNFVVEKSAGGEGGGQDLVACLQANSSPKYNKCLPGDMWGASASCKDFLVAVSLFKVAYACALVNVQKAGCQWLWVCEVQGLAQASGKAAERAQKAERLLADFRVATALTDFPKPLRGHKPMARASYRLECYIAQSVVNRFFDKWEEAASPKAI